jgi:hypothetical protein
MVVAEADHDEVDAGDERPGGNTIGEIVPVCDRNRCHAGPPESAEPTVAVEQERRARCVGCSEAARRDPQREPARSLDPRACDHVDGHSVELISDLARCCHAAPVLPGVWTLQTGWCRPPAVVTAARPQTSPGRRAGHRSSRPVTPWACTPQPTEPHHAVGVGHQPRQDPTELSPVRSNLPGRGRGHRRVHRRAGMPRR